MKAIEARLDTLEQRLNDSHVQQQHRPLIGSNVWVLVPLAAIIMWGLRGLF
ncbi:hypothetical protein M3N64_03595 [Sporolactobacillus sp. CPB3-1]|uniref:Uncharacterized protein n=1 Tax=Sporolactobacillus mangiferae TaxID=2940498 RepID=A0ABT0M838_9BACL|nr:hypothetical protein [Sporolactobacillus mangiferae]MCL1631029.1 hypothetical protein [Sporolactobacillus mangiferae]